MSVAVGRSVSGLLDVSGGRLAGLAGQQIPARAITETSNVDGERLGFGGGTARSFDHQSPPFDLDAERDLIGAALAAVRMNPMAGDLSDYQDGALMIGDPSGLALTPSLEVDLDVTAAPGIVNA
jgi:hypothetical protein